MKKTTIIILAVASALLLAGAFAAWVLCSGFGVDEAATLYIDSDDDIDSVGCKIEATGKPGSMLPYSFIARALSLDKTMHTGRYAIAPGETMLQLVRRIRNHSQQPVNLVVPSHIRTMPDMAARLAKGMMVDSAAIAEVLTDSAMLAGIGYTETDIYTLFVPNTYEVWWDESVDDLVKRLQKEHDRFWNDERKAKLAEVSEYAGTAMDETAVATLASIVDSETANNGEKADIAALYMNRLRIGMPLQSDPTVKFALKAFALRRILHEHLAVESPYNTYRNEGLPPGPICVPTIAGIDAVLNHSHHNYIYMCAKEDFSGTHNFAVTYAEHQQNARRYTKALDARGIK